VRRAALLVGVLLGLAPVAARAQPPPLQFDRLSVEDGLSGATVMAVTREGGRFLWAGTQYGVDRYDGARIRTFAEGSRSSGLPRGAVRAIAADPATPGALWVGTETGTARYDPRTERFTPYRAVRGDTAAVAGIARVLLPVGRALWVGTAERGLLRFLPDERRFEAYRRGGPGTLPSDTLRALAADPGVPDRLWVGTARGLVRMDTRRRAFVTFRPGGLGAPVITALATSGGAVWCATMGARTAMDARIYRLDPATGRVLGEVRAGAEVSALVPSAVYPGVLWVGTRGQGVFALDTRTSTLTPANGTDDALGRADVMALTEDAAGLLWVGTTRALYKADVRGPRFTPIPGRAAGPSPLTVPAVLSLYEAPSDPGGLWLGTMRGGLHRYDRRTGQARAYPAAPGAPLSVVFAIHEAPGGTLWLGGPGLALHQFDRRTGETRTFPLSTAPSGVVYRIYEAPSMPGVLWVATQGAGLVAFDAERGRVRRTFSTSAVGAARIGSNHVWAVVEAPDEPGVLWAATDDAGLYRIDVRRGAATPVRTTSGCRMSDRLLALAAGPGALLWIGTLGDGLLRYDRRTGACTAFTPADGLASPDVASVYLDARRRVWMSTRTGGLALFDPARRTFTRFSAADGLQSNVFFFPAHHQSADGELFFGGPEGFNAFHPERVRVDTTRPPVVLTRVLVEGEPYPLRRAGGGFRPIRLPYDRHDLTFEFASLDLRNPEKNRYRVRLAGADAAPRELGDRPDVRYPFLPPGHYTLSVEGTNADGYWSPTSATLAFVIRPPYWQTWYFWTLIGLGVLGLVAGAYQYRIRQLLRVERTRRQIAADLHDDAGSALGSIALRIDLEAMDPARTPEERGRLRELSRAVRSTTGALRDTVWLVKAANDSLPALVARMESFAGEILRGRPYRVTRPDTLPTLPISMERRRDLFFLYKEALHNAAKYGGPPVDVHVAYEGNAQRGRLRFSVADAGPGFDPGAPYHGNGLDTMRGRAEALGGTLRVESAPGQGTTVALVVDLP